MTRARISIAAVDETGGAFQSVRAKLDKLGAEASAVTSRFSGISAGVTGLLGLAAGATGFGALIMKATETVTRLKDLSEASGSSIENVSRLTSIAERAGIGFGTTSAALLKFNQALNAANGNSPAAQVIERLGLSVAELRKQDPAEALVSVAQGLERFADNGDRARAQALLFGEGVGRIAPLLKELNGGLASGAALSSQQAEAYDALAKSSAKLTTQLQELGVRAAGPAVSSLGRFFELADKAKAAGFNGFFGAALAFNTTELDRLGNLNERLTQLAVRYREVSSLAEGVRNAGRAVPKELESELASLERREKFLRALQKERGGGRGEGPGAAAAESIGAFDTAGIRAVKSAADDYVQSLRDQLLATRNLGAEEQARIAINRGLFGVIDQGLKSQAIALARALDVRRADLRVEEEANALREEGKRLALSLRTELEQLSDQRQRADLLESKGLISLNTWLRAYGKGVDEIGRSLAELKMPNFVELAAPLQQVSEFAAQAARNIQDALGDSTLQVIKGNADSIGAIWKDLLQRMAAQAIAAQLGQALFGNFGKTGEFGGLVGAIGSSIFGGARANGGPVMAGRAYLVGERGPEVIVPQSAGTVVPNGAIGGLSVVNQYHVAAGVSRGELIAAMQLTEERTKANMMATLRAARVV